MTVQDLKWLSDTFLGRLQPSDRDVLRSAASYAFLSGSVAYGWDSSTSDIDVHVVTDLSVDRRGRRLAEVIGQMIGREWDIDYRDRLSTDQLLESLSWERYRSGDAAALLTDDDLQFVARLWHGAPLTNAVMFDSVQQRLKASAARWVVTEWYLDHYDHSALDVQGQIEAGDNISAVMSAREAIRCVAAAALAGAGELPVDQKWRARQMREANPGPLPFTQYWRIETMADYTEEDPAQWARETIYRCQKVVESIVLPR